MVARFVMKSNKKRLLFVLAILTMAILLSCAFVACNKAETQDAQKKEFTITFDTQGGSEITPITIRSGESLTLPKTPTKEGYVFDGWYLDSNCIEEYEDSYVVSKNITLYAKWRELVAGEEFNVIFNLNYGTDNIVEKTTENRLITYIPVRQGYRFNGWYYSDGYVEDIGYILTEKYDTTIPVTQNGLVLYAEWVDSSTDSRQLASPTISVNGTVLSWDAVKNAEKYELKFYLGKNLVKTYSTTQSSVNIDSIGIDAGTYTLKARSIGDGVSHINSAETIKHISYKVLLPVSNAKIDVESSILTWNEANNAETYTVYIDGARFGRTYLNSLDLSKLNAGQYVIKIVAERAGYTSSNATFTLVKSRLLTPTIKIERQPNDNYSSKISWSAIYNANQYVVVVDKKEVATTTNNYYVLNDSDWGSNKKVSVSVYAKDSSADYLVSIPSEISTVTRTAKIAISHNIRKVSLVKVVGKSYSSTDNLIENYSSADNFYVGVDFGEPKKVVAIPQNGYTWLGWYDKSGNLISTKTEYIFDVNTSSSEIVAHWASYSVALNKNDNNAGKIGFSADMSTQNTVSQRIMCGNEVTIYANTNNGYTWLGWYKGEEKVSDEQTYTFTMSDSDLAYTAKWSKTTISVSSSSAGRVSGLSSTYKVGDKVTVTAVTNNGYTWDGWYLNGEKVSSDLQYEIQITEEPLNYVATWKYYTLTTSRNISAAGTVNSYWNQKVTVGDSVELVANTNKGYTWLGWYDGETLISSETTFTYEMPAESKTLIAKWTYYTLSTQTNNSEAGTYTVLSDKKVTVGDSIELIASTNDGYTWLGWYDGETLISMETTYTYVMTAESKTLAAKWTYYTLSTQANDSEAGTYTVLSDKKVTVGDSIELIASTNDGYTWLGWYDGETMISSETTYTYVMPAESKTLIAKWTYYTLSTTNGNVDAGDITLLSYKKVAVGRSIDLIAVAKPGYSFVGWYDGEKMLSSDATYSYVMTSESKIITAKWNLTTYRIVYSFSKDNVEFESDLPASYTIGEESIILQELNNGNYYVDYWYYEGNEGKRIKIIDVEQKRDLSIVGHVASCGLALSETSVQGIGSCTQRDVLLPRYNGETEIVTIADNAFKNNTTINHVSIPYSVTSVGSSAFYGCTGLMSVTLGNSVTSIGSSAFYNCSRLVEIYNKSSLKIKIGDRDNGYIAYYAKNVYTEEGGNKLSTDKAGYVTYLDGEERILVAYNGTNTDLIIPSGITVIAEEVFKNRNDLTSVTIPDSVTSIGKDAFYNTAWYNNQPDGLVYAGKVAYKYKGTMPENTSIVIEDDTFGIADYAFYGCTGLTSVTIGNGVTSIGDSAFIHCSGLTSITIPDSVTNIGDFAFKDCKGLTSVTIGNSVTSIGEYAFSGCTGLTNIIISDSVSRIGKLAFYYCIGLTSITIPDSVTSIGYWAFEDCKSLTTVNWNATSCTSAGSSSFPIFAGCSNLTTVNIGDNVTTIPTYAFHGRSGLTKVTGSADNASKVVKQAMPNSFVVVITSGTNISDYAFRDCVGLTSITIPDSVMSIGKDAFYNTAWYNNQPDGLVYAGKVAYKYKGTMPENTSIVIEDDTFGIADYAFYGCTGLTSVTIGNGVTSIGSYAFYGCSSLTSITIPDSVTNIGENAFYNCNGLTRIDVSENNTSYASVDGILYNKAKTEFIIIPKAIQGVVTIPSGVTNIGNWAFFNCNGLTSIFIPSGVNEIGEYAFYLCRNLVDVFIPNSVAGIGQYAFYNCSKLERISFDGTTAQWENITKGGFWRYNTPSDCQIICNDPELEPMTEVKLEMPSGGYNIGGKWYQLPCVDNAFAYKFTFGNGDDDGIILNRSTLTFYDIPIDAKYIEYKALGGVLNGVRYLDSDSRRVDLAFWHYPVKYQSETYSVRKLLKKKLKLSEITSIKFGKLEEEHGESALKGTSFWRGRGGYLLIEGSDANGVPKKLYYLIPGKDMSLGEMFDRIPELVYYDELSVEEVNDTNRFELEDFKYYMQNEIIPHMQEHFPKYAAFFNTCDMADYEISNYVGFGVYNSRYDHEDQVVSVDLKNAQGRTLHLELEMDMRFGSVANWKYVREHKMLFSQVKTINPRMSEELHFYWIFPTTYFDNDGDKAIKPNEEFNQKIIDTESNGIAYIYPSINYYLNGEEKDTLWDEHLSYLSIYPMPFLSKIKNKTYTFVTNCEQTIEPITGERYTVLLPKLTREGYVFCGWYDNEAFEGRAYFDTYGSSDKSTLYAKWLPKEEPPMPDGTSLKMAYIAQSGQTYDVNITDAGQIVYFAFKPTVDGTFTIQSIGSCDTYGNLYSSTQSLLATNDDGGTGNNFKLTYNMKAGTTYYIAIRLLYTSATGTFKVSFS